MHNWIHSILTALLSEHEADMLYTPVMLMAIALISFLLYWFCLRVISVIVRLATRRTSTEWDDDLLNDKVLRAVSQLAPALLVSYLLPEAFDKEASYHIWLIKATDFYILWAFIHLINTFLQTLFDALDKRGRYKIHTMRGVLQMLKLFSILIGIVIGISILIGKTPMTILTALGASAAVLMLVFQDTILGLVAGIQLTVNDMLKKGDWIEVPKSNANGEVEEISLTTVKVRNWDNSVTTIPPYNLIKDSFNNYQPMREVGARRVSRYIYINVNTVRFLTSSEIETLTNLNFIDPKDADQNDNGMVNLSMLSSYLERYLAGLPLVRTDQLLMVRQLQPTPQGIPLELYFFTNQTEWKAFEHVQARIFDYVYATIHAFGLEIYQAPTGSDFKQLQPVHCSKQ
ncbi:MAG: mechanosensitive ion channel family protein [Clostridiales bacterium]|nr:mechanosensitive ion channel family protein [Clostridiales bacterium]